jgi:hypothetical protein
MTEQNNHVEEDEISLLDLFVVLLKYRKLIIIVTLVAVIIAAAGYFLYPPYQYQKALEHQRVEAYLRVAPWPGLKTLELNYDLKQLFAQAPSLLYALRAAGYESFGYGEDYQIDLTDETLTSRALFVVQQRLLKNQSLDGTALDEDQRLFSVTSTSEGAVVVFKDNDPEQAKRFLAALFDATNKELTALLLTQADSIISAYERLLAIESPSDLVQSAISAGQQRYDTAMRLQTGQANAINQLGGIYIVDPELTLGAYKSGIKVKVVILVVAALFLSIFLAFILNYLNTVKKDEESMRKIREALKKKK